MYVKKKPVGNYVCVCLSLAFSHVYTPSSSFPPFVIPFLFSLLLSSSSSSLSSLRDDVVPFFHS